MGLNIGAINSGNSVLLWLWGQPVKLSFSSYYLILSEIRQRFHADEYKIPHHRQYLSVACKLMTTEQIFTTITVGLTSANVLLTYFNLRHNRKKEFQDKLFHIKIDAYKTLNDACYEAVKRLDVNSTPYVEIYNYNDKDEWVKFCDANMGAEILESFKLQDLVYRQTMYLPKDIVDKFYYFTGYCISFVSQTYLFDTGLIISNQDRLWDEYIDLLNLMRKDLNIELIDAGIKHRISSKM